MQLTKKTKKILGISIILFPFAVMYIACGHSIGFKQASIIFGGIGAFIACIATGAKLIEG